METIAKQAVILDSQENFMQLQGKWLRIVSTPVQESTKIIQKLRLCGKESFVETAASLFFVVIYKLDP